MDMVLDEDRETPVDGGGLLWDAVVGEQGALPPTAARAKLLHIVPAGRVEERGGHFIKSFVSISCLWIGVIPCFFFFFFTVTFLQNHVKVG